jgi:hypothetical protein
MRPIFKSALLLLALLCATIKAQDIDACNYKNWPIWAGGSGDEKMKVMAYDPTMNYILAGGTS